MSECLNVCPSVHLSVGLSVLLDICLPVYLLPELQRRCVQVRVPKRHVISEYQGTGVKLSCPGAKLDHLLLWKNDTYDLNPFLIATESAGRISYINHLVLHIRNLTKYDSGIYRQAFIFFSCNSTARYRYFLIITG